METIPTLVCKDTRNDKINHIDPGMCRKLYGFFGPYVPEFECGDRFNTHYCKLMTKEEIDDFMNRKK